MSKAGDPGARSLALEVLAAAQRRGESVEDLTAATLQRFSDLSRPERGLMLEMVQGVKRWEIRLDYVLSRLARRPLKKLHPLVLLILRLSAYQLLFLDRVPARAVLHEAGRLAQGKRLPQAHRGFINAVLRRLAAGEVPPLPDLQADWVLAMSIATAHPAWLVRRWLDRYGPERARARLEANNRIPPLTIRVNTLKTDATQLQAILAGEGVEAEPCRLSPVGLRLTALAAAPLSLPSYQQGLWLFQDEAAQLVSLLAGAAPGRRVVELGAGRGGKTTHLAEMLGGQGLLLAVDYHRRRLQELRHNLARWGAGHVAYILQADAARPLPIKDGSADLVVLDAPCSALGIVRRHPEIKTSLQESDLATFPPRQRAMLAAAAPLVRPGGRLLYLTCSPEPAENEEVIASFLSNHPDFHLHPAPAALPPAARHLMSPSGFFRTAPEIHEMDGFFGAVLVRD